MQHYKYYFLWNNLYVYAIIIQVLITQWFFAQGSYQSGVGNDRYLAVAQPILSVVLNKVIKVFNERLCLKFIQFMKCEKRLFYKYTL